METSEIRKRIEELKKPKRKALSLRFPMLKKPILGTRILLKKISTRLSGTLASTYHHTPLPFVLARHQSVLRRTLGTSDPRLQEAKITNLKEACKHLNELMIYPGETFSLWHILGAPTKQRGYVDGMLLSAGSVQEGVGGGLCQMSNFLCWIFLHAPMELIERHHHSYDVFPDSGRTLPFGSGATCFYNLLDLRYKNISPYPIQLRVWTTENHLKGELRSIHPPENKYSIRETFHAFVRYQGSFYRVNELTRIVYRQGKEVEQQALFSHVAPVLYAVTKAYLDEHHHHLIDLDAEGKSLTL